MYTIFLECLLCKGEVIHVQYLNGSLHVRKLWIPCIHGIPLNNICTCLFQEMCFDGGWWCLQVSTEWRWSRSKWYIHPHLTFYLLLLSADNLCKQPGCIGQSVTCLTADPGVGSLIPAQSYTFAEIDHEIISTAILLTSADSKRVSKACPWKNVVRWTDRLNMIIAVDWDVKNQTKQNKTFANGLDPDQAWQNFGPDLDPNCLTLWWCSWKKFSKKLNLKKKISRWNLPCRQRVMVCIDVLLL